MDCSPERLKNLVQNVEVEFDADISGPGVLAAFIITSLIALATLISAFLTISVPASLLNTGDAMIATGAHRAYHRLRAKFTKTKRTNIVQGRDERAHAFMAFMIVISDQMLVSQASILIAALIIRNEITIYSSNIVIALGCLAATVHMGSFPFYKDRIKDHGSAKLIRVLAMVAGSGILVFLLVIQVSYNWDMESHVYFTCTLQDYQLSDDIEGAVTASFCVQMFVPVTVVYGTYEIVQFLYRKQPAYESPNEPDTLGQYIHSPQYRANLYAERLQNSGGIELQMLGTLEDQLNTENLVDASDIEVDSQAIISILQLISHGDREATAASERNDQYQRFMLFEARGRMIPYTERLNEIKESRREQLLNKWLKLKALMILTSKIVPTRKLRLLARLTAETWAFHQCRGSFAWRLFWLWSGNVYGIVTIITSRAATTGMSGNPDRMGFGQVVPLTLLALPIFTAIESHDDYKQKLESIEKSPIDQANFEPRSAENARPQSRSQSHAQRQDMPEETDIERIRTVQNLLKQRAKDIGYPELYNWVTEDDLTSAPSLQMPVAVHAIVMFTIATLLGVSMAYGITEINITLIVLLFILAARRLWGLYSIQSDMKSYPMTLHYLGYTGHLPNQQSGSQGESMAVVQSSGDTAEDSGNQGRQDEA